MATTPTRADITSLMNACNCSQSEAMELLKHSGNDLKQAERRHQMRLRLGWASGAKSFRPAPASHFDGTSAGMKEGRQTPRAMQDNEDYDIITPQSDQEVFPERSHDAYSSPQRSSRASYLGGATHYSSYDRVGYHSRPSAHDGANTVDGNVDSTSGQRASYPRRSSETPQTSDVSQPVQEPGNDDNVLPSTPRDQLNMNSDHRRKNLKNEDDTSEQEPENEHDIASSSTRTEWDFILPKLSTGTTSQIKGQIPHFSIRTLVEMIQVKADAQVVENYLERAETHLVRSQINRELNGFPSIFYVVAINNDRILRSWIARGADVNAVHSASGVPILAFAICCGENIEEDTTDVVATLLSTGSSPAVIPEIFYKPYDRDLVDDELEKEENLETTNVSNQSDQSDWLYPTAKQRLVRNLNLTHRYNLERASRIQKPSLRQRQVAERYNAQGLLGLPYFLIGQSLATNKLLQTCISHLVNRNERRKPLVLVFAGPSGHGKTELARRLGYLMSLDLQVVDCTIVNREIELFGGRHPYVNAEEGTPINNFLAKNSGQRCIVFLDEFEKTTRDIHQALLLPFDNGEYQDRRNLQMVDCSRTIWILATNALDKRIRDFCKVHEAVVYDDKQVESRTQLMKQLDKKLKNDLLAQFDAPITGRISAILPFLLFSPPEQAVIAHKYLLELGRDVRRPVNLTMGPHERLIGDIRLHVRRDASLCAQLARDGYHPDLGARSLITAVDSVRGMLVTEYLEVDETIRESDELIDFAVHIRNGNVHVELCS